MKVKKKLLITGFSALFLFAFVFLVSTIASKNNVSGTLGTNGNGTTVKNVIIMISDGCGYNQILATDYYTDGVAGSQLYEQFPVSLGVSTYHLGEITKDDDNLGVYDPNKVWSNFEELKKYPTDSAAAGTAIATGFKTYKGAIGVDQDQNKLKNMVENFESLGKSTGVVTSVGISQATPAAFVAHNASRTNLSEIANEMLKSSKVDVIMGVGNPLYDNSGNLKPALTNEDFIDVGGKELWDGLATGSIGNDADGDGALEYWKLIQSKSEFEALQTGNVADRIVGIPQIKGSLQQSRGGDEKADAYVVPFVETVPDLSVMAKGALNVLDNDQDGFFLMIEGGSIDTTGHYNQSGRLIEEEQAFNEAVEAVYQWVQQNSSWDETLLIVTGDHETGYLTGSPGVYGEVVNNGIGIMPGMAWNSDKHTNQLIPFFAIGAGSADFLTVADQKDPVRGDYLDNTEISQVIKRLLNIKN